ncbi:asparagine synthase (glutamine-hydrolyzing) [Chromobacterium violaceum]|uniref:asparagine synthase (glutamine-hydrolyzing) n=1 Tax=Chromobacterium violaceum TaxID=536 RepID=UPI0005D39473|nr:asparagine synthase (glutamine-hydrolyzing) [Chromobacterium violaceum]KJH69054.1 asparagine synthase [Chromobacterium violaceum]KMN50952.1 asparagine synthase [Chromobacterium violaceum]KMN87300.1 asparagine synthase [Chromobacterium violaceum]KMN89725.1 asparagine synthase [Chromobacterium violaceum]KMO03768.1 asparagine synthase [Chromobacterium violaceum]
MCGIAGFFSRRPVNPAVPQAMLDELHRRGPDDASRLLLDSELNPADGGAIHNAMLHARLAIVDPRPVANQPMASDDGQVWICYNGEVYDWEIGKAELEAGGAVFRTHSDTEFILRGYQAWGIEGLLERLRGMFAFAILDKRSEKVHLARDRMGEKPLLYSLQDGDFAYGSLVRAVLPFLPADKRAFSPAAIDAYLAHRYIPSPATVFSHINRLENGYRLEFDLNTRQLTKQRYWQPKAESGDWLPELDRAVAMRTVADRPLGVLLSGGIDSTVIASRLATQQLTQFSSFTAAFPGSTLDESGDAADSARRMGLPNVRVDMPENLAADFERIVADLDQPFADPSSFPTWYLAREVTKHVKVVLVGDGGDELLAGYKRMGKHLRTRWRQNIRLPLPIKPQLDSKRGKLATELAMDWKSAYSLRFSGFTPGQRSFLQGGRKLEKLCHWRAPDDIGPEPGDGSPGLHQLLELDFANYLPDYILQKSDLCTMAHGLEGRAPLLDHGFYQRLLSTSAAERYTRPAKLIFRRAIHPALPADFFQRKKRGFNPPLSGWLKTSLAPRFDGLGARLAEASGGQLDAGAVDAFARAYRDGAGHLAEQMLQLLILDESLAQLRRLCRELG